MTDRIVVRKARYHDSAFLMQVSRRLQALPGLAEAVVVMGTDLNRQLLRDVGFIGSAVEGAGPMDLLVALRGTDVAALDAASAALDGLLSGGGGPGAARTDAADAVPDLADALVAHPDAAVVSIAVPGPYAAFVASRALDAGRHVFLFSDNVPVEDEIRLKDRGVREGLLVMGPDCGTSILAGVGLGFANRVPRGPVGVVGPSGTGIQEVTCLLARAGLGTSAAIGTGGRDLSARVGGPMTTLALRLLAADPDTRALVLVAKHPDDDVARRLHALLPTLGKPVAVRYLATPGDALPDVDGVTYAASMDAAVDAVIRALGHPVPTASPLPPSAPVRGRLVGLFGGGSLAGEAREVLRRHGLTALDPDPAWLPGQPVPGTGHVVVDTGDDVYTRGRPHPMVDQAVRLDLLRTAGLDPGVGLVLVDLVLGDGAHPDPAPEWLPVLEEVRATRGPDAPCWVASVTGTSADPQDLPRQEAILRAAGVHVLPSAFAAATWAARSLKGPVPAASSTARPPGGA